MIVQRGLHRVDVHDNGWFCSCGVVIKFGNDKVLLQWLRVHLEGQ